jgi:biotin carboxyl carrier protein
MQRRISIGERTFSLEVLSTGPNGDVSFRLQPDGDAGDGFHPARDASVIEVMPRVYSVLIEGRSLEARVISENGETVVEIEGHRYPVLVEDPRRSRTKRGSGVSEGKVTAPMPGKVVRVLVAQGDAVTAGQGLVVIEAMKMQNELKSPRDGHVTSLGVREGETVTAGAVLAVVE